MSYSWTDSNQLVDPWANDEPPCCKLGSCGIINRFCFSSRGTSALYTANSVEMIKDFQSLKCVPRPIYGKLIQPKFMGTYSVLFKFGVWAIPIIEKLIQSSILQGAWLGCFPSQNEKKKFREHDVARLILFCHTGYDCMYPEKNFNLLFAAFEGQRGIWNWKNE